MITQSNGQSLHSPFVVPTPNGQTWFLLFISAVHQSCSVGINEEFPMSYSHIENVDVAVGAFNGVDVLDEFWFMPMVK